MEFHVSGPWKETEEALLGPASVCISSQLLVPGPTTDCSFPPKTATETRIGSFWYQELIRGEGDEEGTIDTQTWLIWRFLLDVC